MTKPILSKGIYKKLAIMSVIVAFCIGLIISLFQIQSDYKNQNIELNKEIINLVSVLKPSAEKAIFEFDETLGQLVTDSFFDHSSVLSVTLYDDHGDIFRSHTQGEAITRTSWLPNTIDISPQQLTFKLDIHSELDDSQARIDIIIDPYLALNDFFNRSWLTILFEIIKVVLLTIIFLFVCYRLVTKPIKDMAEELTDLDPFSDSQKTLSIAPHHSNDEIGFLGHKVNN